MARLLVSRQAFEQKTRQSKHVTLKGGTKQKKSHSSSTTSLSKSLSCSTLTHGPNQARVGWVAWENVLKNRLKGKQHNGRMAPHVLRPIVPIQHVHITRMPKVERPRGTDSHNSSSGFGHHTRVKPVAAAAASGKEFATVKPRPKVKSWKRKSSFSNLLGLQTTFSADLDFTSFDAASLTIVNIAPKSSSDKQNRSRARDARAKRTKRRENKKILNASTDSSTQNKNSNKMVQKQPGSTGIVTENLEPAKMLQKKETELDTFQIELQDVKVCDETEKSSGVIGPVTESNPPLLDIQNHSEQAETHHQSSLEVSQWFNESNLLCVSGSTVSTRCVPLVDENPKKLSDERALLKIYASTSSLLQSDGIDRYAALEDDEESVVAKQSTSTEGYDSSDSGISSFSSLEDTGMEDTGVDATSRRGKGRFLKGAVQKTVGWFTRRTIERKAIASISSRPPVEKEIASQQVQEARAKPNKSGSESKSTSEAIQRAWLEEVQLAINAAKEKRSSCSTTTDDESGLSEGSSIILSETDEEYGYEYLPTDERLQTYAARHLLKDLDDASVSSLEILYKWFTCSKVEEKGVDPSDMIIEVLSSFDDSAGRPIRRFRMRYSPSERDKTN